VTDPRVKFHSLHPPPPPADAGTRALPAALLVRRDRTNQPLLRGSIAPALTRVLRV
jgi:hypothetical protein